MELERLKDEENFIKRTLVVFEFLRNHLAVSDSSVFYKSGRVFTRSDHVICRCCRWTISAMQTVTRSSCDICLRINTGPAMERRYSSTLGTRAISRGSATIR